MCPEHIFIDEGNVFKLMMLTFLMMDIQLVGGFNPFEKY